jgi:hypothetical protein
MNRLPLLRLALASMFAAVLGGCASTDDAGPSPVLRTPPPQGYEKAIDNFFAFKIRGSQDNAAISVGAPEPGACALGGYSASSRGWVVPTVYETRTRDASGKGAVQVATKQYYFWFLGNTIAGISPRLELCPGAGAGVTFGEDVAPKQAAQGSNVAAAAEIPKQETVSDAKKKSSTAPASARPPAKKASSSAAKVTEPAKQTRGP